jgi:hypothetical protein
MMASVPTSHLRSGANAARPNPLPIIGNIMMIRPYRPTIAGLMAFVLFVALTLAALRHEDQYRGTGTHNLALLAIWAATVCAIFGKESVRDQFGRSIGMVLSGFFGAALSPFVAGKCGRRLPNIGDDDDRATAGMG